MYRVIIFFAIFTIDSTFALELKYKYGLRQYHYQGTTEKLSLRAPGVRLTIEVKKCNKDAVATFENRYQFLLNKTPQVVGKRDIKKIQYSFNSSDKSYLAPPASRLGQELLRLPEYFTALKLQSKNSCSH